MLRCTDLFNLQTTCQLFGARWIAKEQNLNQPFGSKLQNPSVELVRSDTNIFRCELGRKLGCAFSWISCKGSQIPFQCVVLLGRLCGSWRGNRTRMMLRKKLSFKHRVREFHIPPPVILCSLSMMHAYFKDWQPITGLISISTQSFLVTQTLRHHPLFCTCTNPHNGHVLLFRWNRHISSSRLIELFKYFFLFKESRSPQQEFRYRHQQDNVFWCFLVNIYCQSSKKIKLNIFGSN